MDGSQNASERHATSAQLSPSPGSGRHRYPSRAEDEGDDTRPALGFSNLVVRLEQDDRIGLASADFRVHILEALRHEGFRAVGFENLVFGKNDSNKAELSAHAAGEESCAARARPGADHDAAVSLRFLRRAGAAAMVRTRSVCATAGHFA